MNEEIINQILTGDLEVLYNLLQVDKEEDPKLKEAHDKVKNGVKLRYHIMWNLRQMYDVRDRQEIILFKGEQIPIEEWWNEEEERSAIARKALMDFHLKDDQPYRGR